MEPEERHRLRVAIRQQLEKPSRTLRFTESLEARYEAATGEARTRHLVRCCILGMTLSNAFVASDLKTIPDAIFYSLALHFLVLTPFCSASAFYMARNPAPWRRETVMTACAAVLLFGTCGLLSLSRAPQSGYLCTVFVLYLTFMNLAVRLRFAWCMGFSAASVASSSAVILLHPGLPDGVPLMLVMIMFTTATYTLHAAYTIEHAERRGFLLMLEQRLDAEELAQANATLNRLSSTDALTGLANRRTFDAQLARSWSQAGSHAGSPAKSLALLMIDVDHFKSYNDHHGHPQGDACLAQAAAAMAQHLRCGQDLLARYGGEEFALIMADADLAEAVRVAERIRCAVEDYALPHGGPGAGPTVTISVGVAALCPAKGGTPQDLVGQADEALYLGKRAGRNRVHALGPAAAAVTAAAG